MRDGSSEPNSNTPDRLSAITKNSSASAVTTAGDCSWKPQPSCSPAARSATIAAPSSANATMTPAANATPSRRNARRSSPACAASASAFSDSTGNTQGIRFSSRPPANAKASASGSDSDVAAGAATRREIGRRLGLRGLRAWHGRAGDRNVERDRVDDAARRCAKPRSAVSTPCKPLKAGRELVRDGQRQLDAAVATRRAVCARRRLDLPFAIGEELQRAGVALAAPRRQLQRDRRAGRRRAAHSTPPAPRAAAHRASPRWTDASADRSRALFGDRQRERQVGALRNARFPAHQPIGARAERRIGAGLRVGRDRASAPDAGRRLRSRS